MPLVDKQIKWLLSKYGSGLKIDPIEESQIGPCSIDLTLAFEHILYPEAQPNSPVNIIKEDPETVKIKGHADSYNIYPGQFLLASTIERITIPKGLVGFLEGRSSIGRLGLFIHNAGFIDSGFEGNLTLELFNANNFTMRLTVGMKICQLILFECEECICDYGERIGSKYQGQMGATESRLTMEGDKK